MDDERMKDETAPQEPVLDGPAGAEEAITDGPAEPAEPTFATPTERSAPAPDDPAEGPASPSDAPDEPEGSTPDAPAEDEPGRAPDPGDDRVPGYDVPVERVTIPDPQTRGATLDPGRMVGTNRTRSRKPRRGWNFGYFLREGIVSIFRHGLMSFAAVCMTVACLLIMGTFTLVAVNLDANFRELERRNEFSAYLDESLSESQARGLEEAILAVPNVRQVQFVDRLEVLEEFRAERPDDQGLFALLPDDTFRHRFRVYVNDLERLEETVNAVEQVPGVADTSSFLAGAEGMVALRNVGAGVALILVAILAVVSLFIIANTLRLATFYRRDEIAIMRMCGATKGFICWPFVAEGVMLGLFSAGLAFGAQWLVYNMIARSMASAGQLSFLVVVSFQNLWPAVLATFCGGGLAIGVLGSLLAIRRFLKV